MIGVSGVFNISHRIIAPIAIELKAIMRIGSSISLKLLFIR